MLNLLVTYGKYFLTPWKITYTLPIVFNVEPRWRLYFEHNVHDWFIMYILYV